MHRISQGSGRSIQAVAFDLGNTLIDTDLLMQSAVKHAATRLARENLIPCAGELVKAFIEQDRLAYFPHINHLFSHLEIVERAILQVSASSSTTRFAPATTAGIFLAHYRWRIRDMIHPNHELSNFLSTLREEGLRLGIISNGTLDEQMEVLVHMGIVSAFDDILISEEVGVEKPSERIFHLAAERLEVAPCEMLFVGDSWIDDIVGASSAGLTVVAYARSDSEVEDKAREAGYQVVNSFDELADLLSSGREL